MRRQRLRFLLKGLGLRRVVDPTLWKMGLFLVDEVLGKRELALLKHSIKTNLPTAQFSSPQLRAPALPPSSTRSAHVQEGY
jgi:hypothetical protein